jgi:acetyl esterase/lipase
LAPEHPYPAALHDAASVYELLQRDVSDGDVVLCGDSAGGGLALALALACRTARVEQPRGLVLLSPWVDLTISADTYKSRATSDELFSAAAAHEAAEAYLQGCEATEPFASPLWGHLGDLPPVLLFAGGDEVLLDDAVSLAARIAGAGGTVEAHFVAGMQHVWPTLFPALDASVTALEAIARFVGQTAAPATPGPQVP